MGKFIYAILSGRPGSEKLKSLFSGMKGIAEAELEVIAFKQISAVISDIEKMDLVANQTNALIFAHLIEILEQEFPLLPMRFGSVMESSGSVLNMLENNYSEFCQSLHKVENQSEFGLKIFSDTEKLNENLRLKLEIGKLSLPHPNQDIKKSVYLEYINKKLADHRLEELLLAYIDSIDAEFTDRLNQWNAALKIKKKTTANIIVDAAFLLRKDLKKELVQVVIDLQNEHPELNYILTGPWPPYNFVDITLK
jgi:hypothetical protein